MVTHLAWMAHRLESLNRPIKQASAASCKPCTTAAWILRSFQMPLMVSYMTHWNGALLINSFVDLWYWWISLRATVPGLNLLFFFNCHDGGLHGAFTAIFLEALVILLAAPSIPFLAVCFVLAILDVDLDKTFCKMTIICVLLLRCLSFQ